MFANKLFTFQLLEKFTRIKIFLTLPYFQNHLFCGDFRSLNKCLELENNQRSSFFQATIPTNKNNRNLNIYLKNFVWTQRCERNEARETPSEVK